MIILIMIYLKTSKKGLGYLSYYYFVKVDNFVAKNPWTPVSFEFFYA